MDYTSKNHSKFSIKYHIIFVVKYRKFLLENDIDLAMKILLKTYLINLILALMF